MFVLCLLLYGANTIFGQVLEPTREFLQLNKEHVLRVSPYTGVAFYVIKLPKANQPLFMYVTPCSSAVHWQLRIPNQFALGPYLPSHSEHFDHILHMRIPPLIEYHGDVDFKDHLILLAGEENDKRMHFYANSIEASYVVLNMSSDHFSAVKLFVSTDQASLDEFYPALDEHNRFHVGVKSKDNINEVKLNWSSLEFVNAEPDKYKYCLLISDHADEHSLCEHFNLDVEYIHCVHGNETEMTIPSLRAGKRHYLSLFLINRNTKGKTSFVTEEVFIKEPTIKRLAVDTKESNNMTLLDSALSVHSIPLPKGSYVNYTYIASSSPQANEFILLINACNGYVSCEVLRNDSLIYKAAEFIGFKRFIIKTGKDDIIKINVINNDHVNVRYWIWASANEENSPFPSLPFDRSIRLVERHCNAVKLEWLRANDDENTRYCVHIRESRNDYLTDIVNEPSQMCWSQMPVGRKVVCVLPNQASSSSLHSPGFLNLETVVDSLKTATMYRFDLSVQRMDRKDAQPLPYRPIFVRTLKDC